MSKPLSSSLPSRHHLFLPSHSPQQHSLAALSPHFHLSIASYNTLSPSVLYRSLYPYASKQALKWKYRRSLLFKEISSCNASIVCAQEVSFIDQWRSAKELTEKYDGFYYVLGGNKHGSLIMTQKNRFECCEEEHISFAEVFARDEDASEEEFALDANVAQIVVLRERDEKEWKSGSTEENQEESHVHHHTSPSDNHGIILSNTHLFWNYRTPYIRLRQLLHIFDQCLALQTKYPNYQIILCGDLNFTPDTPEFKLFFGYEWTEKDWDMVVKSADNKERRLQWLKKYIFERKLPRVESVYQDYRKYFPYTGKDEESVENTTLWEDDHPVFTVWANYHGTLDYILMVYPPEEEEETEGNGTTIVQPNDSDKLHQPHKPWLKNVGFLKLEEDTELGEGIPNDVIPSDHLMIMGAFEKIR